MVVTEAPEEGVGMVRPGQRRARAGVAGEKEKRSGGARPAGGERKKEKRGAGQRGSWRCGERAGGECNRREEAGIHGSEETAEMVGRSAAEREEPRRTAAGSQAGRRSST